MSQQPVLTDSERSDAGFGHRLALALAAVGGARRDALDVVPGAAGRYIGMAATLTFTATVAAISAAAAVSIALKAPLWASITLGVFWGLLIFNLDRLLLVTLSKDDSRMVILAGAVARVMVAGCLAVVISTPVTLVIFRKEINQQLQTQESQAIDVYTANQNSSTDGAQLKDDQNKLQALDTRLAASTILPAAQLKVVAAAQAQVDKDIQVLNQRQSALSSEADGTGGSHKVGCSAACDVKKAAVVDAQHTLHADRKALHAAQLAVATAEAGGRQILSDSADQLSKNIAGIQLDQRTSRSQFEARTRASDGLLARVEALWSLGEGRPAARYSHVFVFLLFFTIELLPILVKLLSLSGPKTNYEQAADRIDDTYLALQEQRADVVVRTAQAQVEAQLEAAKALSGEVIEAQKEVFRSQLRAWVATATAGSGSGTGTGDGSPPAGLNGRKAPGDKGNEGGGKGNGEGNGNGEGGGRIDLTGLDDESNR